jgi:hypothetical protein
VQLCSSWAENLLYEERFPTILAVEVKALQLYLVFLFCRRGIRKLGDRAGAGRVCIDLDLRYVAAICRTEGDGFVKEEEVGLFKDGEACATATRCTAEVDRAGFHIWRAHSTNVGHEQ